MTHTIEAIASSPDMLNSHAIASSAALLGETPEHVRGVWPAWQHRTAYSADIVRNGVPS